MTYKRDYLERLCNVFQKLSFILAILKHKLCKCPEGTLRIILGVTPPVPFSQMFLFIALLYLQAFIRQCSKSAHNPIIFSFWSAGYLLTQTEK